jgi:hypothetical protein
LIDWKGKWTSSFDKSCIVWVIVIIIGTISTFILTKHTYCKVICLCERHLKIKTMEHCIIYTKYAQGGFLLMGYWYPFMGVSFCVCSTPLRFPHHLVIFKELRHMCMCYVHNLDWHFICAPMVHPRNPHQIHVWKGIVVTYEIQVFFKGAQKEVFSSIFKKTL